ncbi:hypothetical protein [Streptomyces sp. NPDC001165]|uniref:hypothetical protein n=1 Tax=Streptomyces sp. NPDC001165 TaxID=3364546 RepID=UPI003698C7EE
MNTIPGTKPPPSIRAFFQVYVSAASVTCAVPSAASAGGLPASNPAARAGAAVRMRVLRTVGSFREVNVRRPGDPLCGWGPPGPVDPVAL